MKAAMITSIVSVIFGGIYMGTARSGGAGQGSLSQKQEEAIKANADKAALVIEGTVTKVRPIPEARLREAAGGHIPVTEHNPRLMEAVIEGKVLKGEGQGQTKKVVVVFASSRDPYNRDRPKFKDGDKGIMILHKEEIKSPEARKALLTRTESHEGEIYTALERHDFIKADPKTDPQEKRLNALKRLIEAKP